jgi:hypothetical protein
MSGRKLRQPISEDRIAEVFSDKQIQRLATLDKLPKTSNLERFGKRVREVACVYAREARTPSANQVYEEVANLHKAAARARYDELADLLAQLSEAARDVLKIRRLGIELPTPDTLRDPDQRAEACEAVVRFSSLGGGWTEGRMRPTGRRSRTWKPKVWAPAPSRHFPRRKAERSLVTNLKATHLEACGQLPPHRPPYLQRQ